MSLNPKSSMHIAPASTFLDFFTPRPYPLTIANFLCPSHSQAPSHICTFDGCPNRLICQKCLPTHQENHKCRIYAYEELLGADLLRRIDHEMLYNIFLEQKKENYLFYIKQLKTAMDEIKKRVASTLDGIYATVKEKIFTNLTEPTYMTSEWEKMKKALLDGKQAISTADPQSQTKCLEDYIQVYNKIAQVVADAENLKEVKSYIDMKAPKEMPILNQEHVDDAIKSLRVVLNNFSIKISPQIYSSNSPQENMEMTKNLVHRSNNLTLTSFSVSPMRLKSLREQNKIDEVPSNNSLMTNKEKIALTPEKQPQDNSTIVINKSAPQIKKTLTPEDFSPTKMPPFIYDEHLDTEVMNLPYIGPIKLDDGTVYKGQMRDKTRLGKGKQIWVDGRTYEGYFKENLPHGKGRMMHPDNDYYEGDWVNGMAHGSGRYVKADGWVYEGEWMKDKPHGKGVEIWPDGSKYEGQYEYGFKRGKGKLISADGSYYMGEFRKNVFEGEGRYYWADGRKYEGNWSNNKREGKGAMYWPNGSKYEGEFCNEKRHGFGRYEWGDGRKYVGHWKDGRQHGHGKLYNKDGQVVDAEFLEGRLVQNVAEAIHDPSTVRSDLNSPDSGVFMQQYQHKVAARRSQSMEKPSEFKNTTPGGKPRQSVDSTFSFLGMFGKKKEPQEKSWKQMLGFSDPKISSRTDQK